MKKLFAIVVAMMAFVAFAGAAWAQATEPGPSAVLCGSICTDLGYQTLSKDQTFNQKDDVITSFLQLSGHSYLRGTWTSADKTTGGHIEINALSKENDEEKVGLRYAYGWWKVGNCQLVAGQTDGWLGSLAYMPMTTFGVSQSAKTGLINWGFVYSSRSPQIRLEWRSGNVGFSVAAVQPASEQAVKIDGLDRYSDVPRFDIATEYKTGGFMTTPALGWSQVKYQGVASGMEDSYNSWIVMLPLKYTVGPFTAKVQLHTGANTETEFSGQLKDNMRAKSPKIMPVGLNTATAHDTEEIGGVIALEYALGSLVVTGGYGQVRVENDSWRDGYDRKAWFVAVPFAVTKNFTVSPEFQYYMYGDHPTTTEDMGNEWLLGLQCKFLF